MAKIESDFSVSHADDAIFESDGLRPYFEYRDLGIKASTKGAIIAHVIRAAEAFDGRGTGPHRHECDFQLVYVLAGWARFHYDGVGEVTMKKGSCFNQPPGIAHNLIEYSDDFEVLEIVSPANFGTEDLEAEATEAAPA
jgi:mannose-6-phosphate isomerase-like protein (cupin superfamily)